MTHEIKIVRRVASEDLSPGQYITPLWEWSHTHRLDESSGEPRVQSIRYRSVPYEGGTPYRVESVALPFVLAFDADGDESSFDVRKVELALLPESFGDRLFVRKKAERRRSRRMD